MDLLTADGETFFSYPDQRKLYSIQNDIGWLPSYRYCCVESPSS